MPTERSRVREGENQLADQTRRDTSSEKGQMDDLTRHLTQFQDQQRHKGEEEEKQLSRVASRGITDGPRLENSNDCDDPPPDYAPAANRPRGLWRK